MWVEKEEFLKGKSSNKFRSRAALLDFLCKITVTVTRTGIVASCTSIVTVTPPTPLLVSFSLAGPRIDRQLNIVATSSITAQHVVSPSQIQDAATLLTRIISQSFLKMNANLSTKDVWIILVIILENAACPWCFVGGG